MKASNSYLQCKGIITVCMVFCNIRLRHTSEQQHNMLLWFKNFHFHSVFAGFRVKLKTVVLDSVSVAPNAPPLA